MDARGLVALLLVAGCRADPHVVAVRPGQWCPADFSDLRPHAIVASDAYLLDTGATLTRLSEGEPCPESGELDLCALVVAAPLCGTATLRHIVGVDTLAGRALSFDVTNNAWAVSSAWEASPASPPVKLGCTLPFVDVASDGRAFVTLDIEGTSGEFLVDTGSVDTMVRQAQFDALVADGRVQRPVTIGTAYGTRMGAITTSAGVSPCGASVPRDLFIATGIDDLLDGIDPPDGKRLAGVVGAGYLMAARTVLDLPASEARIYFAAN